ncbi:MAG TPA: acetyl-CoA carboxylase biotin carboxylase subunit [Nitrososphaeraceae archaeon]|nr:acetyl-CoA carboxylase biotin carboxylase subunit [Nitrososphaeraceae archaeon]
MEIPKKISTILIANRGEIALRIIRACRHMSIKSIAVYSDEDQNSLHVKFADECYHIGAAPPSESYLNIDKIIETAKKVGADAIHPGYGFLSENEGFAERCEKENIIFIGPTSKAMELTGDKMKCKVIMKDAKVPTVPGSDGTVENVQEAISISAEAGYPVLLKSAFGGGGRGIRMASDEKQLKQEFEMASEESRAAFGKSALFVEKYLEDIRHIEFQLLLDSHGNGRHLFERECSIQRRHQKLVEFTPSPVVDSRIREEVGEIAVRAAQAVNYLNAGTAEFLRDKQGKFYFIEINSRLQVEHPVTELVTGLDLVKLQIQIAQGEEINFRQEDLKMQGAALECRINAEDPFLEFAPSVGLVPDCNLPYGPGIRVDSYLYPGCTVSGYYDSLIAKLISWGRDFEEARVREREALKEFRIEGISTTIPLFKTILDEQNFLQGRLSTDYLERYGLIQKMIDAAEKETRKLADAAVAAFLMHSEFNQDSKLKEANSYSPRSSSGWTGLTLDRKRRS